MTTNWVAVVPTSGNHIPHLGNFVSIMGENLDSMREKCILNAV